ncbi:MAG: hypothetical protein WC956_09995 [bacterium]
MAYTGSIDRWNYPNGIAEALPLWKREAIEGKEALIVSFEPDGLPSCILSTDIDQISQSKHPLIGFLQTYAESSRLMSNYRSDYRNIGCLERAALLLKHAADLMLSLPTDNFADLQKVGSLCFLIYDRSRAVFLDVVGADTTDPVAKAFLYELDLRILGMAEFVRAGAMMVDIKTGGGEGGGDMGSPPPVGDIGGLGPAGGFSPFSADGAHDSDDAYAEPTSPYGLELGAEMAMLGTPPSFIR